MTERVEERPFAELVAGREGEFPVLARAVRDQGPPLRHVRVEWMLDVPVEGEPGVWRREVWVNYAQIVRYAVPVAAQGSLAAEEEPADDGEALEFLLRTVEGVLVDGVPEAGAVVEGRFRVPRYTCGGYRHYLGRELRDGDVLSLRVLREPFRRAWREESGRERFDWLAEFSLEVRPGAMVAA